MKKTPRIFFIFLFSLLLINCATTKTYIQAKATKFHALEQRPYTFIILPEKDQQDTLQFRTYANFVEEKLKQKGWSPTPYDSAEILVFIQYQISQGHEVKFNYPIFGSVPSGTTNSYGTVTTYGNTSTITATTKQETRLAVIGAGTSSRMMYDRALRMTMYSLNAFNNSQKIESIYEGEIRSEGTTNDLPAVMPALLDGIFQDFPGKSGTTSITTIPIQ